MDEGAVWVGVGIELKPATSRHRCYGVPPSHRLMWRSARQASENGTLRAILGVSPVRLRGRPAGSGSGSAGCGGGFAETAPAGNIWLALTCRRR